jgi:hypothetical protein
MMGRDLESSFMHFRNRQGQRFFYKIFYFLGSGSFSIVFSNQGCVSEFGSRCQKRITQKLKKFQILAFSHFYLCE